MYNNNYAHIITSSTYHNTFGRTYTVLKKSWAAHIGFPCSQIFTIFIID